MRKFLMTSHLDSSEGEIKKLPPHVYRKRNVTRCIAEVVAMENMSAAPIENKVGMLMVVVSRKDIKSLRVADGLVTISD